MAYVSDELYDKYRPPIYRTTKDTFNTDLQSLLNDETERNRLSKEGIEYVRKLHDRGSIVKSLDEYYEQLRFGKPIKR